jgi:Radical SAM superfamily/Iron-sulfur cluster-binding domain
MPIARWEQQVDPDPGQLAIPTASVLNIKRDHTRSLFMKPKDFAHEILEGLRSLRWPLRPGALNLELTAACDARCVHCPRQEMDRPQRPMDLGLFRRIIDQAADLKVREIIPNGYGELLVLKALPTYLKYLRSKPHHFIIAINTNGYRLTDERIQLFVDHQVELVNITIDGATRETAEAIRVRLKFDQIEDNVHRLLAARDERGSKFPMVTLGMVLMDRNRHEAEQFLERWRGVADRVILSGYSSRGGSLSPELNSGGAPETLPACVRPFRELNVWADGKAVLCCNDWNEEYVVGDLNRESLVEVWQGEALKRARLLHLRGRGAEINLCANCNQWEAPGRARLWN